MANQANGDSRSGRQARSRTLFAVANGRFDVPTIHALLNRLDAGSAPLRDIEIESRTARGDTQTLAINAQQLHAPDHTHLILMAFQDITQRKRDAEARYRRLFESARDGIILLDGVHFLRNALDHLPRKKDDDVLTAAVDLRAPECGGGAGLGGLANEMGRPIQEAV
jgi:PAS domain-containing protein